MNPITKFWSLVESQPDSLALVSPRVQMNYRELGANVSRFAAVLRRRGVKKGDVVGFDAQPELDTVLMLAALQLGATSLSYSPQISKFYGKHIDHVIAPNEAFMRELGMVQPLVSPELLTDEDVVRVSFSSGTTGAPKGIPFSASSLLPRTESVRRNWLVDDPFMSLLGLETVTGILAFYWCVFHGKSYFVNTNAKLNLKLVSDFQIRSVQTSPAKLNDLILEQETQNLPLSLEKVYTAGSLATPSLVARCTQTLNCQVFNVYGSTEVGSASIGAFDSVNPHSLGQLVLDVDLEIVGDDLKPLPNDTIGNIRYRKPFMPTGYWNSSSQTNNGFSNGWFYPGDRALITNGDTLVLEGRNDDLVNAAGNKFNLAQLDLWLADSGLFDDVASFSEINEQGETTIGIVYVSKNQPKPELLVASLKEFMPNLRVSKMFAIGAIPRNKMDKVDRVTIQQMVRERNA